MASALALGLLLFGAALTAAPSAPGADAPAASGADTRAIPGTDTPLASTTPSATTPAGSPERLPGQTAASSLLSGASTARPGEICLVCGHPVGASDVVLVHRGRRVVLHQGGCLDAWNARTGALFASLQPRGALFQEPEEPPSPLRGAWFLFGLYVVVGLIAGATCAYVAVGRGLRPIRWFFAALLFNVVALVLVLARPAADMSDLPAGVPKGLAKVPTTRAPSFCPVCGAENHPAARACLSCGAALERIVEPETTKIGGAR